MLHGIRYRKCKGLHSDAVIGMETIRTLINRFRVSGSAIRHRGSPCLWSINLLHPQVAKHETRIANKRSRFSFGSIGEALSPALSHPPSGCLPDTKNSSKRTKERLPSLAWHQYINRLVNKSNRCGHNDLWWFIL
jgi:hypothetical protein